MAGRAELSWTTARYGCKLASGAVDVIGSLDRLKLILIYVYTAGMA